MSHNGADDGTSRAKDARIVKTHKALSDALLKLLQQKPFEQVTVREICKEAGVHYATFFRHHTTKEDLFFSIAATQIEYVNRLTLPILDEVGSQTSFQALFHYIDEHRLLWSALLTGGAAATMREALLKIYAEMSLTRSRKGGRIPPELARRVSASSLIECISWWVAQPPGTMSVKKIAEIVEGLVRSSMPFDDTLDPSRKGIAA